MSRLKLTVFAAYALCMLSSAGQAAPYKLTDADRAIVAAESAPNESFVARLKGPPRMIDGQQLHPKLQVSLEATAAHDAEHGHDIVAKRADNRAALLDPERRPKFRAYFDRAWPLRTKAPVKMKTQDVQIPGTGGPIAARIYTPKVNSSKPLPVLLYMHGGGWVMSSMDAVDPAVNLLANEAKVIVVSIEYRLAPEHPFPAAHQDTSSALDWVEQHAREFGADPNQIGIGGDSAGANMAAWVSQKRLEQGRPVPKVQLLYYPALDLNLSHADSYPSHNMFSVGYAADKYFTAMARGLTFATPEDYDAASPLRAKSFRGLPTTIVVTAGFDMLRDQGREYAKRLIGDGGSVVLRNYPSLIHGFMQYSGTIDDAYTACVETARLFGEMIRADQPYGVSGS